MIDLLFLLILAGLGYQLWVLTQDVRKDRLDNHSRWVSVDVYLEALGALDEETKKKVEQIKLQRMQDWFNYRSDLQGPRTRQD